MTLFVVEMRRALHRRVVRVLVALAVVGCVVAGVISFFGSAGKEIYELHRNGEMHPAVMADWWVADVSDGVIMIATLFLLLGGLFGGAAVAGGEWRAGTVVTTLTWEPRRMRFLASRFAACGCLAFVISFGLQMLFLGSFLPSVVANGTTSGVDGGWWVTLALVVVRTSALTAAAALVGVALATLGRSTAFALMAVFAWMAVIENLVRGLRPGWAPFLWGENVGTVVSWSQLDYVDFERGPVVALITLAVYAGVLAALAAISFRHRDVAAVS